MASSNKTDRIREIISQSAQAIRNEKESHREELGRNIDVFRRQEPSKLVEAANKYIQTVSKSAPGNQGFTAAILASNRINEANDLINKLNTQASASNPYVKNALGKAASAVAEAQNYMRSTPEQYYRDTIRKAGMTDLIYPYLKQREAIAAQQAEQQQKRYGLTPQTDSANMASNRAAQAALSSWLEENKSRYRKARSSAVTGTAMSMGVDPDFVQEYEQKQRQLDELNAILGRQGYYEQNTAKYGSLSAKPDYASTVAQGRTNAPTINDYYTYFNDPTETLTFDDADFIALLLNETGGENEQYVRDIDEFYPRWADVRFMTEEQKNNFFYLKQQDPKKAVQYVKDIYPTLTRVGADIQKEEAIAATKENPVGASIAAPFMAPLAGFDYFGFAGDRVFGTGQDALGSAREAAWTPFEAKKTITDTVSNDVIRNPWGKFGYGVGMSMADNLVNRVAGAGSSEISMFLMGSGAATQTYYDAKEKGRTEDEALTQAAAAGVIEYLTEKMGFENLTEIVRAGKTSFKSFLKNAAKQGIIEGMEEGTSNIANLTYDILAYGADSDAARRVNEYAKDMTEKEARQKVIGELATEFGTDVAGGVLSGGFFGAGGSIVGNIANIDSVYTTDKVAQRALLLDAKKNGFKQADAYNKKLNEGGTLTKQEFANAYDAIDVAQQKREAKNEKLRTYDKNKDTQLALTEEGKELGSEHAAEYAKILKNGGILTKQQYTTLVNENNAQIAKLEAQEQKGKTAQGAAENVGNAIRIGENNAFKAEVADTEEVVSVNKGVADIKGNVVYVETSKGIMPAKDLVLDKETDTLFAASDMFDPVTADVFVKNYNGSVSVAQYALDFARIYNAFKRGDEDTGFNYVAEAGNRLSNKVLTAAVSAGTRAASESKTAGVILRTANVGADIKTHIDALDEFGKTVGRRIIIKDTIDATVKDKKSGKNITVKGGANAYFDERTNEYYIALDSVDKAYLYIAAHESVHDIKKNNSQGFDNLKRVAFDVLKKNGADIESLIKTAQERENLSRERAEEEVLCNTVPAIFSKAETRQQFAEAMAGQDAQTKNAFVRFLEAIREFLTDTFNKLKKRGAWKQMQYVENDINGLKAITDAYAEALKGRDDATAASERKYSSTDINIVDLSDDNVLSNMVDGLFGTPRHNAICNYIFNELGGQQIEMSDGTIAIIDKSDAQHLSYRSSVKKTAQLSKLKEIIKQAKLYAIDENVEHNKFKSFKYYQTEVRYREDSFKIYVNVGKAKNDGKNHIYDLTKNLRNSANRLNDLGRVRDLRPGKQNFINNILQISEKSNKKFSVRDKSYLEAVNNNGNVIPLSERFKDDNEDIRYSLKTKTESIEDLEKANYDRWKSIKPATRAQSMRLNLIDDRNVARYRNEIDEVMRNPTMRRVMVGMPTQLMRDYGLVNAPLYINADNIIKMAYPKGYLQKSPEEHRHNLGFSVVKNLVYQIADPVAITENTPEQQKIHKEKGSKSRIFVTRWNDKNGQPIIVPITILGDNTIEVPDRDLLNILDSAFGINERYMDKFNGAKVLYPENVKDISALFTESRQIAPESSSDDVFAHNIYEDEFFVKNKDLRRSIRRSAIDSEGNELSEQQTEYFSESKVRDENGNLKVMYRGDSEDFTVFDRKKSKYSNLYGRGFYFTDSDSHAGQYGKKREFYLNIKNPVSTTETNITKAQMRRFLEAVAEDEDYGLDNYGYDATASSVLKSIYGKSDFLMLQDISASAIGDMVAAVELFNSVNGTSYDGLILDTEVVTFSSEQAKLTSNKAPTDNEDIRYSLKDDEDIKLLIHENEVFQSRIYEQDKIIEELRRQMKPTDVLRNDRGEIEKYARYLKKTYSSSADVNYIADTLDEMYTEMMRAQPDEYYIRYLGITLARDILEKGSRNIVDEVHEETYKDIRKALKETTFSLTEQQKAEVKAVLGVSYGKFRQMMFNKLNMKNDAPSLDSYWAQFVEKSNGMLDIYTNEGDQIMALYDLANAAQKQYITAYQGIGLTLDEAAVDLFADMRAKQIELKVVQGTFADKMLKRIEAANARTEEIKQKERQKLQDYKEWRAKQTVLRGIKSKAKGLKTLLEKPKERSGQYVPDALKTGVLKVLNALDFSTKNETKANKAWAESLQVLSNQLNYADDIFGDMALYLNPYLIPSFIAMTERVAKSSEGQNLEKMSVDDLKTIRDTLESIRHAIETANNLFKNERYSTATEAAEATMQYAQNRRHKFHDWKKFNDIKGFFNVGQMDAYTYFSMFGEAGQSIIDELSQGQDAAHDRIREAAEWTDGMRKELRLTHRDMAEWKKQKHTVKLESGESVTLTVREAMEFYVLSKREQARGHILGGGFSLAADSIKRTFVSLSEKDIYAINNVLTDKQKNVADAMQKYLSTTVADWGNETSKKAYGVRLFNEPNYWRIRTVGSSLDAEDQANQIRNEAVKYAKQNAAINAGFTKHTNKFANNPILVGDIFDSFDDHISGMATYNGLGLAIDDANKWLMYAKRDSKGKKIPNEDVKTAIRSVLGEVGVRYAENLLMDMNGLAPRVDESILSKLMSNYKKASVAAKIRVIIQQPTAVLRAMSEINPAFMTVSAIKQVKPGIVKEMQRYSSIAWWKSNGNYDIGTGKSIHEILFGSDKAMSKISNVAMLPAGKADDISWAIIWQACKEEYAQKNKVKIKSFTESDFDKVSARFSEIINKTQVVDTILHRSQNMRSKTVAMSQLTAFMSEPTKIFNMIRRGMVEFANADKPQKFKTARHLMRILLAWAASATANAAIKSLWDAFRKREREKEYSEQYQETFISNVLDEVNPLKLIPVVNNLWSVAEGYDQTSMPFDFAEKLKNGVNQLTKFDDENRSFTMYSAAANLASFFSSAFGLPLSGLLSNFEGVWQAVTGENIKHKKSKTENFDSMRDALGAKNTRAYDKAYNDVYAQISQDIQNEKIEDPEEFAKENKYLTDEEVIQKRITSGVKSVAKRKYYDALIDAFESGESDYKKMLISLEIYGIDGSDAGKWVKEEYAEEYITGRDKNLSKKLEYAGFDEDDLLSWVTDSYKEEVVRKMSKGDKGALKEYVKKLEKEEVLPQNIWTRCYSIFRDDYLEAWKNGDKERAYEIEEQLKSLGLRNKKGKSYANRDFFKNWRKAATEDDE